MKKIFFICFLMSFFISVFSQKQYKEFYNRFDKIFPNEPVMIKAKEEYYKAFKKNGNSDDLAFSKIIDIIYLTPKDSIQNLKAAYDIINYSSPQTTAKAEGYYWAAIYQEKNSLDLSREYLEKAIKINLKNKNSYLLPKNYHILGRNYYKKGEYQIALGYFRKALNYFTKQNEITQMSSMYNNFGLTYAKMKNYPLAMKNTLIAKNLLEKKQHFLHYENVFLNSIKVNLGTYSYELKDYDNALHYYEEVYQYTKEYPNNKQITSKILTNLYTFYLKNPTKLNDFILWLHNSLDENYESPFNIDILRILQKDAINKGNIKNIQLISQKLNYYEDKHKSFMLREQSETTKELNKYLVNSIENEKLIIKQKEKINYLIFYFILILTLTGSYYLYKINQLNKKKAKIKNDLLIKEKNIIEERMNNLSLNLEIKSKTEKEFLLRLKKIKKDKNYETEEIIKDLHLSISSLLNIDKKQYLELEKNNKINDSFIQKIKLDFPLLTPQEIQLCGYVHLSLSNKEIALLENITAPSVRVYKTRLKAKLGLSKEQDLETFLKTIYL